MKLIQQRPSGQYKKQIPRHRKEQRQNSHPSALLFYLSFPPNIYLYPLYLLFMPIQTYPWHYDDPTGTPEAARTWSSVGYTRLHVVISRWFTRIAEGYFPTSRYKFQIYGRRLKSLGTWSKFRSEDPQVLAATVQNSAALATGISAALF